MASNQTNENVKELINDSFTEMIEVLEAYGESYNIARFLDNLSCLGSNLAENIMEDIVGLDYNHYREDLSLQDAMENFQQQMQENGLDTDWLENGFEKAKNQKLLNLMVQDPMEYLQHQIGKIISNDRNQGLRDLFEEVEELVTQPFNNLDLLIAEVKEKLENFLEVENDQQN